MGQKSVFYVEVRSLHTEVTGSCYICKASFSNGERRVFLIDCGMFQEQQYQGDNEKLTFNAEEVCFVLVTHNHVDHVGRLPLLYRRGYKGYVYASVGTAMALPINLEDTIKIINERAKISKKLYTKSNGRGKHGYRSKTPASFTALYSEQDVQEVEENLVGVHYYEWVVDENLPSVRFKFFPNAHLPGAASIWVQVKDDNISQEINLFFMGDWNVENIFQGKFDFPEELRNVPVHVVSESTYGSTFSSEITKSLKENIIQAISEEKVVLLPVISQCRTQEMLWHIKDMKRKGEIPESVPVHFCGPLGGRYTELYSDKEFSDVLPYMKDFIPSNLTIEQLGGALDISDINYGIYIVTGGMGSHGPSVEYLRKLLPCPNVFIQFSSYCAEDTLGRRLMIAEEGEKVLVGGAFIPKVADVKFTSELSGHAKADQLIQFIKQFNRLKTVMVSHGSHEAKERFASLLEQENIGKEVVILSRQQYVRLNPWGVLQVKVWID